MNQAELQKLKMDHAITVNEKEMVTTIAREVYCARIRSGESSPAVLTVVDEAEQIAKAVNDKYDEDIAKKEKAVREAMEEAQKQQLELQKQMQAAGGKIVRAAGNLPPSLGRG